MRGGVGVRVKWRRGGGTHVTHGRSRMTIGLRIPATREGGVGDRRIVGEKCDGKVALVFHSYITVP